METNLQNKKPFILFLFICTIIFYGFSLPFSLTGTPHFSSGNDFSNHANIMHQFAESFKEGQLIPRTIPKTTAFSDGTEGAAGIPTFQYYGFFEGLFALPLSLLHVPDALTAVLSSIAIRFLGLWLLYETCILLGASSSVAFLASFSFLISPYTMTVFYGRGALAESFAQSLLIMIPYGYALAYRGKVREAIIFFSLAFLSLSLCHNIFFLYGALLLAILSAFSFRFKIMFASGVGAVLGLLLSAWQWMPSEVTIKDTTIFGGLNSWKIGAIVSCFDTSMSGLYGFPQPYQPTGYTQPFNVFFTAGWWTIPFIILGLAGLLQKGKKRLAVSFFIAAVILYLLTFPPYNLPIYRQMMPKVFSIVQTSSRLLGFVSLLCAICFAIGIPKLHQRIFKILLILMLVSQFPVFIMYIKLVHQQTWSNEQTRGAPINYYYSNPNTEDFLKMSDGTLDPYNQLYIDPKKQRVFLRLTGSTIPLNHPTNIFIATLKEKPDHEEEKFSIKDYVTKPQLISGNFSVLIELPNVSASGWYKVILSPKEIPKTRGNLFLSKIDLMPDEMSSWIFADSLKSDSKLGYFHKYLVLKKKAGNFVPDDNGYFNIELPHAYSKLFKVTQGGKSMEFTPNFNHRIMVRTKDLSLPIFVCYSLAPKAILLTLLGFLGFFIIIKLGRKQHLPNVCA